MKFQPLEIAFLNEKSSASVSSSSSSSSSLNLGFKRLRPVTPAASTLKSVPALELKSFNLSKASSTHLHHQHVSLSGGGTRWNPTQEQIRKLESLYKRGIRTPNAQQIEKITAELIKHGRIEGKNVFYWFQNHKARERQKQKRNSLLCPSSPMDSIFSNTKGAEEKESKDGRSKRRSRSWGVKFDQMDECGGDHRVTLELFPLHPEKINETIYF